MISKNASNQRSNDGCYSPSRANETTVFPSIFETDNVRDGDLNELDDSSPADSLNTSAHNEPGHTLCSSAESRTDQKDRDASEEDRLSASDIRQFSVKRGKRRSAQEICASDPTVILPALKLFDNGWKSGGYDSLIQRCEEHTEHQSWEYNRHSIVRENMSLIGLPGCTVAVFRLRFLLSWH